MIDCNLIKMLVLNPSLRKAEILFPIYNNHGKHEAISETVDGRPYRIEQHDLTQCHVADLGVVT